MPWVQNGFVWTLPGSIVATVVGSAGTDVAYSCVGDGPVEMHSSVDEAKQHSERMLALLGEAKEPEEIPPDADEGQVETASPGLPFPVSDAEEELTDWLEEEPTLSEG